MKKLIKDIKGTTLFEALTGIAILTIVSVMLLGGFITAQRLMGVGDNIQNGLNTNQSNIGLTAGAPTSVTNKSIKLAIGGTVIVVDGELEIYDDSTDDSAKLGVFVNK